MDKEVEIIKLKEKYPSLFKVYSPEHILFALGEKTAQKIADICIEHRITKKEEVEGVAFRVTYALFGKLPKESLPFVFENGLGIEKEKAESIAKRIDEIIFSDIEKATQEKKEEPVEESSQKKESTDYKTSPSDKKDASDTYREPLE